jgi:hypothetical protein
MMLNVTALGKLGPSVLKAALQTSAVMPMWTMVHGPNTVGRVRGLMSYHFCYAACGTLRQHVTDRCCRRPKTTLNRIFLTFLY